MIELRTAYNGDVPFLRTLWDACFVGDTLYRDFFFDTLYPTAQSLVAVDNDRIVGMLHMLPQTLVQEDGQALSSRYLYAIATHPEARGQGICRRLTHRALDDLRADGVAFATLVPGDAGLFALYAKLGFSTIFTVPKHFIVPSNATRSADENDLQHLKALYDKAMAGRVHVQRDLAWWRLLMQECRATGGQVIILDNGYIVYGTGGCVREVLPLVADSEQRDYGMAIALNPTVTVEHLRGGYMNLQYD